MPEDRLVARDEVAVVLGGVGRAGIVEACGEELLGLGPELVQVHGEFAVAGIAACA